MTDTPPAQTELALADSRVRRIPIDQLLLDAQNPRLTIDSDEGLDQSELASLLWKYNAVDEIALSIAANGYYEDEPLLVIPTRIDDGLDPSYVVVEGNRRLAAVKILTDVDLRTELKATSLPLLDPESQFALQMLPAVVHSSREELWTHIGFRHINGIKPWDGLGKSRYIAQIHEDYGVPLAEIARRIGDQHSTVTRLYRGFRVLRQAECDAEFNITDTYSRRFYFSHLYTALSQNEYQDFLNLDPDDETNDKPISQPNLPELKELLLWLFGNRSQQVAPVVKRQYPDLNYLRLVISVPDSLAALRNGNSLETAHAIALGDTRRFKDSVFRASESLKEALGTLPIGYTGEKAIRKAVDDIHILANNLSEAVERYHTDEDL